MNEKKKCSTLKNHKLREMTQKELDERKIKVYMFDHYFICEICAEVICFDSSG